MQTAALVGFLSGNEFAIVAVVLVVLFGGSQLPKLARSIGQAQGELKKGLAEGAAESDAEDKTTEEKSTEEKT